MEEDDSSSPDDPMSSTGSGSSYSTPTASGDVCNSGGDLSGPNGVDQNGGAEGDCIEVKFTWIYTVYLDDAVYFAQASSDPVEICPCP